MGQIVKYGYKMGPIVSIEYPIAASVVFKHLGGAFMQWDTNNRLIIAVAGVTDIVGWAYAGDFTASATAGNTRVAVNISKDAVYEMPLDAATTEATLKGIIGETCDIIVTSDIQYADIDASTNDILEIVDYRYYGSALGEQTVLVRLFTPNITAKGGVA